MTSSASTPQTFSRDAEAGLLSPARPPVTASWAGTNLTSPQNWGYSNLPAGCVENELVSPVGLRYSIWLGPETRGAAVFARPVRLPRRTTIPAARSTRHSLSQDIGCLRIYLYGDRRPLSSLEDGAGHPTPTQASEELRLNKVFRGYLIATNNLGNLNPTYGAHWIRAS